MFRPVIDRAKCEGYGNCVITAPKIYDIADDGKVVLLVDTLDDSERPRVEAAIRGCPTGALSLEED